MMPAKASGKVVVVSWEWYMFMSFCNMVLEMGETRRPFGAWSSTVSREMGWEVISNALVGTASRSGLIGWVV